MANVIDLFCGAGGFSKGFKDSGYTILLGIDNSVHKLKTYSKNIKPKYYMEGTQYLTKGIAKDEENKVARIQEKNNIANIRKRDIDKVIKKGKKVDVIIGSPPCKDFSTSNIGNKKDEDRIHLYEEFFRFVKLLKPTWFVLENVRGFFESKEGELLEFESEICGYKSKLFIVNAKDYGVAQDRVRGFFIGTRLKDIEFDLEKYKIDNNITIEEAIGDLETEISLGQVQTYTKEAKSDYQKKLRSNSLFTYNHVTTKHKQETIEKIREIKEGKHNNSNKVREYDEIIGTITGEYDNVRCIGSCIHPKFDRTFTAREAARFQSFPDDFAFIGNVDEIAKQIGDAVPPIMAESIARMIKDISYNE